VGEGEFVFPAQATAKIAKQEVKTHELVLHIIGTSLCTDANSGAISNARD